MAAQAQFEQQSVGHPLKIDQQKDEHDELTRKFMRDDPSKIELH